MIVFKPEHREIVSTLFILTPFLTMFKKSLRGKMVIPKECGIHYCVFENQF